MTETELLLREIASLRRRVEALEAAGWPRVQVSTDNVADPPTDTNLDTAFGAPATVGQGFVGIVDDNSGNTDCWLCWTNDTAWWYVEGTKAL